ncbi:hypothetical protein IFR05_011450 [Cadophora sp. M221]|nr:hypothetical protein IFR05_011450 [Cadophora sp. M221]
MAQEREILDEFKQVTDNYWLTHSEYTRVNALLLYWTEDDLGVAAEVTRLQRVFEKDFAFQSTVYQIPSKNCTTELNFQLASFIRQHASEQGSLIIVYYAGHADEPDQKNPGSSGWRANLKEGPALDWHLMQPALYGANGDVLVILDCCHAALKTRGSKKGKMELLAACGSGSRVPSPGKLSFTSILLGQLKQKVRNGEAINIKSLHCLLWADRLPTTGLSFHPFFSCPDIPWLTRDCDPETPVYFDLSEQETRSIVLQRLQSATPNGFARRHSPATSFMLLKVSLNDDPTGLQIADWLKSFPPKTIQDVDIEALVLKARRLENIQEYNCFFPGSVLGRLPPASQEQILGGIWGLSHTISSTAALAEESSKGLNSGSADEATRANFAEKVIGDLQEKVQDVSDNIEDAVLLGANFTLQEALNDEAVLVAEAEDSIRLTQTIRQYLIDNSYIPNTANLPSGAVTEELTQRAASSHRLRYGSIWDKKVVVERFQYATNAPESLQPTEKALLQVKRMVDQLILPRKQDFRALPCVGFVYERHIKTFGIVFELPPGCDQSKPPMTLLSAYSTRKRVALDVRIQLAFSLATALGHFHRVGWVHKEFTSENVSFFVGRDQSESDLTRPWLFGFECSRPGDAESEMNADYSPSGNLYRHPERWGNPTIKFTKAHDVYSLGIVCLELALWKSAKGLRELKEKPLNPWKLKEDLITLVRKDIPHMVGQSMADTISTCLNFKEITKGLSEFETHQEFKLRILGPLKNARV